MIIPPHRLMRGDLYFKLFASTDAHTTAGED
jgi:hypothetical protein